MNTPNVNVKQDATTWIADRAGDDHDFARWLRQVNANACDYSGQPLAELPDWSWRDDYDQGLSPADSFVDALASWVQFDD